MEKIALAINPNGQVNIGDLQIIKNNKQEIIELFLKKKYSIEKTEYKRLLIEETILKHFQTTNGIKSNIFKLFLNLRYYFVYTFQNKIGESQHIFNQNQIQDFSNEIESLINETIICEENENIDAKQNLLISIMRELASELNLKNSINSKIVTNYLNSYFNKISILLGFDKQLHELRSIRFLYNGKKNKKIKRYLKLNFIKFGLNAGMNTLGLATAGGVCLAFTGSKTISGFLFGGAIADANNGIKTNSAKEILLVGLNILGIEINEFNINYLHNIENYLIGKDLIETTQKVNTIYNYLTTSINNNFNGFYTDLNLGNDYSEDKILLLNTLIKIVNFTEHNNIKLTKNNDYIQNKQIIECLIRIRNSRILKGAIYGGILGAIVDYLYEHNQAALIETSNESTKEHFIKNNITDTQPIPSSNDIETTLPSNGVNLSYFDKNKFYNLIDNIIQDIKSDNPDQNYISLEQCVRRIYGIKNGIQFDNTNHINTFNKVIYHELRHPDGHFVTAMKKIGYINSIDEFETVNKNLKQEEIINILYEVYKNDPNFIKEILIHFENDQTSIVQIIDEPRSETENTTPLSEYIEPEKTYLTNDNDTKTSDTMPILQDIIIGITGASIFTTLNEIDSKNSIKKGKISDHYGDFQLINISNESTDSIMAIPYYLNKKPYKNNEIKNQIIKKNINCFLNIHEFINKDKNQTNYIEYIKNILKNIGFSLKLSQINEISYLKFKKSTIGGEIILEYLQNNNDLLDICIRLIRKDINGVSHISEFNKINEFTKNGIINSINDGLKNLLIYKLSFQAFHLKSICNITLDKIDLCNLYNYVENHYFDPSTFGTNGIILGNTFHKNDNTFTCTSILNNGAIINEHEYKLNLVYNGILNNSYDILEENLMIELYNQGITDFSYLYTTQRWILGKSILINKQHLQSGKKLLKTNSNLYAILYMLIIKIPTEEKNYHKYIEKEIQNHYHTQNKNIYTILDKNIYYGENNYALIIIKQTLDDFEIDGFKTELINIDLT